MPYIDSTPRDYPITFEEDNLQDVFAQMLIENGWTLERHFYKAVVDTRAYREMTSRVNYAVARHMIFKNADGKLLGFAVIGQFHMKLSLKNKYPIRRPNDDTTLGDKNFGITPSWNDWIRQRFADTETKTNLYFYMLESLPNEELAPNGGIVSIVTMPGMSGTAYEINRDRDRDDWHKWYYYGTSNPSSDNTDNDLEFDGKILSASPFHVIRSALDLEVLETEWSSSLSAAIITKTDPRVMQSPIVKSTIRAEFLEHVDDPIWHTNWWTDSEIAVKGHVDSNTILLTLQADNAPSWDSNLVPTIPLYFGKVLSMDGDKDEGYALFAGTVPPYKKVNNAKNTVYLTHAIGKENTFIRVTDGSKLPEVPAMLVIGGREAVKMTAKEGDIITVEREQLGTVVPTYNTYDKNGNITGTYTGHNQGAAVIRYADWNVQKQDNKTIVSTFDFDDRHASVGEIMFPLLKVYPHYPSNGIDSVMVSRSRFGARYQSHYLSWGTATRQMPPGKFTLDGRKYPRAYEAMDKTNNYKYQFNTSRYSGKIHSTRLYVVHPEEGVRGYLDKAIGFNLQSVNTPNLRVRKENCPNKIYEMYKYQSVGAVSPLTKIPATTYRPIGVGIYVEDIDPDAIPHDIENDFTPAGEVTITSVVSKLSKTIDIEFTLPEDEDLKHVNIYVDGELYAKGITRATFYRITGLQTGFTPHIRVTTVDLADNESMGVIASSVKVS